VRELDDELVLAGIRDLGLDDLEVRDLDLADRTGG
jgi:hypothetical protein